MSSAIGVLTTPCTPLSDMDGRLFRAFASKIWNTLLHQTLQYPLIFQSQTSKSLLISITSYASTLFYYLLPPCYLIFMDLLCNRSNCHMSHLLIPLLKYAYAVMGTFVF